MAAARAQAQIEVPSSPTQTQAVCTQLVQTFETTMGSFKAEIFLDRVPITASNFIDLANTGFYNGIHFHRVIPGFMNQASQISHPLNFRFGSCAFRACPVWLSLREGPEISPSRDGRAARWQLQKSGHRRHGDAMQRRYAGSC